MQRTVHFPVFVTKTMSKKLPRFLVGLGDRILPAVTAAPLREEDQQQPGFQQGCAAGE